MVNPAVDLSDEPLDPSTRPAEGRPADAHHEPGTGEEPRAALDPLEALRPGSATDDRVGFGAGWSWDRVLAALRPSAGRRPSGVAVLAVVATIGIAGAVGVAVLRPPTPATEDLLPFAAGVTPTSGGSVRAEPPAPPPSDPAPPGSVGGGQPVLLVHVAGAVVAPGVVRLEEGARVTDAVAAAGGLLPDADLERVNLAAPIADGERVWVPATGSGEPPAVVAGSGGGGPSPTGEDRPGSGGTGSGGAGAGAGADPSPPVDLNAADEAQLEALPGVGPAIAAAIVADRERNGPFRSVDDLLRVRGIGPAKLEGLRDRARV